MFNVVSSLHLAPNPIGNPVLFNLNREDASILFVRSRPKLIHVFLNDEGKLILKEVWRFKNDITSIKEFPYETMFMRVDENKDIIWKIKISESLFQSNNTRKEGEEEEEEDEGEESNKKKRKINNQQKEGTTPNKQKVRVLDVTNETAKQKSGTSLDSFYLGNYNCSADLDKSYLSFELYRNLLNFPKETGFIFGDEKGRVKFRGFDYNSKTQDLEIFQIKESVKFILVAPSDLIIISSNHTLYSISHSKKISHTQHTLNVEVVSVCCLNNSPRNGDVFLLIGDKQGALHLVNYDENKFEICNVIPSSAKIVKVVPCTNNLSTHFEVIVLTQRGRLMLLSFPLPSSLSPTQSQSSNHTQNKNSSLQKKPNDDIILGPWLSLLSTLTKTHTRLSSDIRQENAILDELNSTLHWIHEFQSHKRKPITCKILCIPSPHIILGSNNFSRVNIRCTIKTETLSNPKGKWSLILSVKGCKKVITHSVPLTDLSKGENKTWDFFVNVDGCPLKIAAFLGYSFPQIESIESKSSHSRRGCGVSILIEETVIDILDMLRPFNAQEKIPTSDDYFNNENPLHFFINSLNQSQGAKKSTKIVSDKEVVLSVGPKWSASVEIRDDSESLKACQQTLLSTLLITSNRGAFQTRLLQSPTQIYSLTPFHTPISVTFNNKQIKIHCTSNEMNVLVHSSILRRVLEMTRFHAQMDSTNKTEFRHMLQDICSNLADSFQSSHHQIHTLQDNLDQFKNMLGFFNHTKEQDNGDFYTPIYTPHLVENLLKIKRQIIELFLTCREQSSTFMVVE